MPTAQAGHDFRFHYYHEDAGFKQDPNDSTAKIPGVNTVIDTAEGSNNAVEVFNPGDRTPVEIIAQAFTGSWSLSFVYTNPWWLEMFFGEPTTSSNTDTWTHTYDGDPNSSRFVIGREASGKERILTGCVATQATISPNVDGLAQVTIQGAYADEKTNNPGSLTAQPTTDYDPMTFADAALSIAGTDIGYVQSGSVSIQSTIDLVRAWGQRTSIDFSPKTLVPSVDFSKINEAGETMNLEKMYGSSSASSPQRNPDLREALTVSLDNDIDPTSGQKNEVNFNYTGSFSDTYGENGLGDPESEVTEEINRLASDIVVTATNEEDTAA